MFADPKADITLSVYSQLSELGFRRSGNHYYRPHCNACSACTPIRVPTDTFTPSRSQKRVMKKNAGVQANVMIPDFHEDHYQLYEKYINQRHSDGDMYPASRDQYRSFLIEGHSSTRFVEFSLGNQLYSVSVVDQLEDGISAIYTFFDPELAHLSPGTFAVLWQLNYAKQLKLPYVYLGYFIKQCQKMAYKSDFQPFEARFEEQWLSQSQMEDLVNQNDLPFSD